MSKKILKRSLALGALMAFVITGSAWAGCELNNVGNGGVRTDGFKYSPTTLKDNYTLDGNISWTGYRPNSSNPDYNTTYLNGYKLTINSDICAVHHGRHYDYNGGIGDSAFTICEDTGYKFVSEDGEKLGSLEINSADMALHGFGIINVDSLKLVSQSGNTIQSGDADENPSLRPDYKTEIYANTIEIESYGSVPLMIYNQMEIGKENDRVSKLTISGDYGSAITTASGATLNLYADEIKIASNTGGIVACLDSKINFYANKGTIESDVYAGGVHGGKGVVNLTLGEGVNWTGKIATDSATASQGIVDLSGTWNLTEASSLTEATFKAGSTLVLPGDGTQYTEKGVYALTGVGDKATLTVENGAKLTVEGIDYNTYNIAKGFSNITDAKDKWDVTSLNTLMQGEWTADATNGLQLKVVAKEAEKIAEDLGVSEATGDFLNSIVEDAKESGVDVNEGTAGGKLVGLANAASKSNNDVVKAKAAAQAVEAVQKMAEAGGNSATAANVVTNVTNVTGQRLSFSGGNAGGNKGGHGVGLLEEGSGAAIWAQYVHGKDSVENMPSEAGASSYEGQYNGIVMGVDFKKVGKFQSGIAFNYGEGDTNSVNTTSPTRSEYDFWGIGYYGNIRNADSNVIFDIGYAKTDSDVTSNVIAEGYAETFEASPETTTWTAGVKVEKLYQNNNVQVVPYTGLRYMSIDPEDYSTKCGAMGYKMERQDIWLLPVGVSIKQEIVNPNGWVVTPKVDLSYIWAFGDTDSTMETNTVFGTDNRPVGYDVMDDGSWMGLVGVEAAMDDWTFGVSYSYQKGDHSESKKWYVDAKYSF